MTGPGIIIGLGLVFASIGFYYALGGKPPLAVDPKDDDPSQEGWPFHNEKLVSDKPWVDKPVPECPVWMDQPKKS